MPHPPTRKRSSERHEEALGVELDAEGRAFLTVSAAAIRGRPVVRLPLRQRAPRAGGGPLTDFPAGRHLDIPLPVACELFARLGAATDRARERWGAATEGR